MVKTPMGYGHPVGGLDDHPGPQPDLEFSCDHGIWKGPPHVTMVYHHLPCGAWKKPCTNCWYMVYPTEIPSCTLLHIYQ
jgi:hypothetical protein